MLELYQNIRNFRLALGLSQQELADKLGYTSRSSIAKIEAGKVDIPQSKIQEFATALNCTPADLMGWTKKEVAPSISSVPDYSNIPDVLPMPEMQKLPLIGGIACGTPILAEQNIEDEVDVPAYIQADFVLRCNGDSMIGAWIKDGDYVCIRIQPDVDDGQIAAVLIDESATLKRVYHQKNGITLMAENPSFPPMVFVGEECENIRIMGKAVACISAID